MTLTIYLIFGGFCFCTFVFFVITCINSFRGYWRLKAYSNMTEEWHKKASHESHILWSDYTRALKELNEAMESQESKIDELRLQIGILSGRMGEARTIHVQGVQAVHEEKLPYKGKKRGPKPKQLQEKTPS